MHICKRLSELENKYLGPHMQTSSEPGTSEGFRNRSNVVTATAFIIPLGLFFPIASMGDFFGQWNNIFLWSAVALSLAACNIGRLDNAAGDAISK